MTDTADGEGPEKTDHDGQMCERGPRCFGTDAVTHFKQLSLASLASMPTFAARSADFDADFNCVALRRSFIPLIFKSGVFFFIVSSQFCQ